MSALNLALSFHSLQCYKCKQPFAISDQKYNRAMYHGESFFCPDGHDQIFTEGPLKKLEKQLQQEKLKTKWAETRAENYKNWAESEERRVRAYKGITTKIKNRVQHGVCPCCNRTFQNLKAHMKTKHPEWKNSENEKDGKQ